MNRKTSILSDKTKGLLFICFLAAAGFYSWLSDQGRLHPGVKLFRAGAAAGENTAGGSGAAAVSAKTGTADTTGTVNSNQDDTFFIELNSLAPLHNFFLGKRIITEGWVCITDDTLKGTFSLFRTHCNCCGPSCIPVSIDVHSPVADSLKDNDIVRVEGILEKKGDNKSLLQFLMNADRVVLLGHKGLSQPQHGIDDKPSRTCTNLSAERLVIGKDAEQRILSIAGLNLKWIPATQSLGGFWISTTEITQKTYRRLMGDNPSRFKGDNLPVDGVSRPDAIEFCKALTRLGAKRKAPFASLVFRLPDSKQWRRAAGEGAGTKKANGLNAGSFQTREVAQGAPNEFGLYDMSGNVAEWCSDTWQDSFDGTGFYTLGCLLGGSWFNPASDCVKSARIVAVPGRRSDLFGFRVVAERTR